MVSVNCLVAGEIVMPVGISAIGVCCCCGVNVPERFVLAAYYSPGACPLPHRGWRAHRSCNRLLNSWLLLTLRVPDLYLCEGGGHTETVRNCLNLYYLFNVHIYRTGLQRWHGMQSIPSPIKPIPLTDFSRTRSEWPSCPRHPGIATHRSVHICGWWF